MLTNLFVTRTDNAAIQLFRYGFVGAVAFLVDFGTLVGLTEFAGLHYLLSAAIAFLVGLAVNYTISIRWVFAERALERRSLEFAAFAAIGAAGLGINEGIMALCTGLMGMHYALSKALSTVIVFFWNFFARRQCLFRRTAP